MASNLQDLYRRSDSQLYGAFKHKLLSNDEAVALATKIDDCLYAAAEVVDKHCLWVRRFYADMVVSAIFKGSKRSFSPISDRYLYTILPLIGSPGWLGYVRVFVAPFRALLMRMLTDFERACDGVDLSPHTAVGLRRLQDLELELACTHKHLFGLQAEVREQLDRCGKYSQKMALPYLRRVVSQAKFHANVPEAFLENYQNGVHGVMTAIGKYHPSIGAFAFIVDIWITNKMIGGISNASNALALPERVWKHKRLLDKHQNKSVEDIAAAEGVNSDLLQDSVRLLEVRNAAPLIEENDENAERLEAYHDMNAADDENRLVLEDQLRKYTRKITKRDRIALSLVFDVSLFNDVPELDVLRETARQLYIAHAQQH